MLINNTLIYYPPPQQIQYGVGILESTDGRSGCWSFGEMMSHKPHMFR